MGITARNSKKGASGEWMLVIPGLGAGGVLASLIYVVQIPGGQRWNVFGTALAISGAAAIIGGMVGFLFGIPRTVQGLGTPTDGPQYQGNTNLEQVSDWLTKIIVGVGLVQVGRALPALSRLARNLQKPLGDQASSAAFGLAMTLSYALLGFLFLYLWSRERLPGELLLAGAVEDELDARESARSDALILVNRQLDSLRGGAPPSQQDLNKAIAAAPDSTRLLSFNEAEHVRAKNWDKEGGQPEMELSIPVFRALIAADTEERYHRNHGSLGWALKDQRTPDWRASSQELTTAITIRDKLRLGGWGLYEANRALCGIKIIEELPPGDPQLASLTEQVSKDLVIAQPDAFGQQMMQQNPDVQRWLTTHPLPVP
jgi:hypothetical protein